jgi:GxxExxY protein
MIMCAIYIPNPHEEFLAQSIVDSAYKVHSSLGPGLLEAVYEHCFCHELKKRSIPYERQVSIPLLYDGSTLPWGVRLDVLVDKRIVCELKSIESFTPVSLAQIMTQLKLVNLHLGFLINFKVVLIKEGIRRVIR